MADCSAERKIKLATKITIEPTCSIDCLLSRTCKSPYMKMDGNLEAPLLFIGESPGQREDEIGKPFVGRAGNLLRDTLKQFNITDFAITNSLRCRPPNDRTPTLKEIKSCNKFLKQDIAKMPNLQLIILLGNIAMQAVLGTKGGISKYSGKLMDYTERIKVMPILHPAHVLRNQDEYRTFCDHIGRIPNALNGNLVDNMDFGTYATVGTLEEWKSLIRQVRIIGEFVYDIETTGRSPFEPQAQIKCIGFCAEPRCAWALPFGKEFWTDEEWEEIIKDLRIIMQSGRIHKIGHNLKFDNLWLKVILGITPRTYWDTQISQFLLNENESCGLKDITWKISRCGGYENLLVKLPQDIDMFDERERDSLLRYCGTDCDISRRVYDDHRIKLAKENRLSFLFHTLFIPVSNVFTEMEYRGIRIDPARILEAEQKTNIELQQLRQTLLNWPSIKQFEKDSGIEFNPNSHVQLRSILYRYEGLPIIRTTEKSGNPSTAVDVLKEIAEQTNNRLIDLLIEYSAYSSLKSKMIKELNEFRTADNRIHTNYWLTETVTGRSSSSRPALQNVIKGAKDKAGIRKCFIADPDCYLVEADYNQHELRCMAEVAEDTAMMEALRGDVHQATAAELKGVKPEDITEDDRRDVGKAFNFGTIYGLTIYGITKRLHCTEVEAQDYLNKFFSKYSMIKKWRDNTIQFVKEYHYVESRTGQRRRFPVWDEVNEQLCREAVNFPIQNLAGHILLYSLIGIEKYLIEHNTKSTLNLEIHDSVICNIHKAEMYLIPIIREIMLTYYRQFIPFKSQLSVDIRIGNNWGEMESWE